MIDANSAKVARDVVMGRTAEREVADDLKVDT